MKKFLILILLIILSCDENKKIVKSSIETDKVKNIELLTFMFQPSLKENTEVVLNFDKKYLTFKNIYPNIQEPSPPPNVNGKSSKREYVLRKPIHPFVTNLTNEEMLPIKLAVNDLSTVDYQMTEGTEIDGTSYGFSILFSDRNFKVGFIANQKTEKQRKLVEVILNLLKNKNTFPENEIVLEYYSRY